MYRQERKHHGLGQRLRGEETEGRAQSGKTSHGKEQKRPQVSSCQLDATVRRRRMNRRLMGGCQRYRLYSGIYGGSLGEMAAGGSPATGGSSQIQ